MDCNCKEMKQYVDLSIEWSYKATKTKDFLCGLFLQSKDVFLQVSGIKWDFWDGIYQ